MKKFLIRLCIAAAFATAAQAQMQPKGQATSLAVNREGIGHMLVVPYFNTQAGNATLVNLFNASANAKALKIRYRGAGNGDDLFSFQVFLRANDAWAAMLYNNSSGVPAITTIDKSCTLPAVVSGESFRTTRLNPALSGDALANQAREGYIEIIAMGDVVAGTQLETAMQPVFGTPPCTPAALNALTRFDAQLAPPTTGLFANWILINVPQTTTWTGEAVAYEARLNGAASTGNVTFFPQTAVPLSGAEVVSYTSDPLFNFANGGPIVAPRSMDLPDLSTPYTAAVTSPQNQATELSFEIAAQASVVEYLTDPNIQASTDWVVSLPTLRYHAAVDYRGPTLISNRRTFGNTSSLYFAHLNANPSPSGQPCYSAPLPGLIRGFDREAVWTTAALTPWYSFEFCGMVPVLSVSGGVGAVSSTTHAAATRTALLQPDFGTDGSAVLGWGWVEDRIGLPVLLRHFSRAVNPSAMPGVSGTYGFTGAGRTLVRGSPP